MWVHPTFRMWSQKCDGCGRREYNRKSGFLWGDGYGLTETVENHDALFVGGQRVAPGAWCPIYSVCGEERNRTE
jgi:hypothetical protein